LIKLVTPTEPGPLGQTNLTEVRNELTKYIETMVADNGEVMDNVQLEPMKRYVSAQLTRLEIERLRTRFQDLQIERLWRDAVKKALISQSANTVQARPANLGYGALGRGVGWAVLDTGIRADHPHFARHKNVVAQWDCTKRGKPVKLSPDESARLDQNGHGTHVAGIIAGIYECPAMAPEAQLYGFSAARSTRACMGAATLHFVRNCADCGGRACWYAWRPATRATQSCGRWMARRPPIWIFPSATLPTWMRRLR